MSLPKSLDELVQRGGPQAFIAAAEKEAGDNMAGFWLGILEKRDPRIEGWNTVEVDGFADTLAAQVVVKAWIRQLRRRLRVKASPDVVRAKTRERVRRLRARRASVIGASSTS